MEDLPAIDEVRTIVDSNGDVYINVHDFEISFISQMYSELDDGVFTDDERELIEQVIDSIQDGLQTFYEE